MANANQNQKQESSSLMLKDQRYIKKINLLIAMAKKD
jgi:hypothetical protein